MPSPRLIDPRLLGTWRSDAERALAERVFSESSISAQQAGLRRMFGKLTLRYTPARVVAEYLGDRSVCLYRVVA